jgi:tripeptide aminopeptidase
MIGTKELKRMYYLPSSSGNEFGMSMYIQMILNQIGIPYSVDKDNQIYSFIPGTPLLSAHMDRVHSKAPKFVFNNGRYMWGTCGIGADDVNGCYAILRLLEMRKMARMEPISFVFSVCEERFGQQFENLLEANKDVMLKLRYGIVIDRRNSHDVICDSNDYGTPEFEKAVMEILEPLKYKATTGTYSNADDLSDYMSCLNISCGYYNPHTDMEYTSIPELEHTINSVFELIDKLKGEFDIPDKTKWYTNRYDDSLYSYDNKYPGYVFKDGIGIPKASMIEPEIDDDGSDYYCIVCQTYLTIDEVIAGETDAECVYCGGPIEWNYQDEEDAKAQELLALEGIKVVDRSIIKMPAKSGHEGQIVYAGKKLTKKERKALKKFKGK